MNLIQTDVFCKSKPELKSTWILYELDYRIWSTDSWPFKALKLSNVMRCVSFSSE